MENVRELYYSALCDTDLKAYTTFVFAVLNHGSNYVGNARVDDRQGGEGREHSNADNVGGVDSAVYAVRSAARWDIDNKDRSTFDNVGSANIVDSGLASSYRDWITAAGFSSDNSCVGCGGVRSCSGDDKGQRWGKNADTGISDGAVAPLAIQAGQIVDVVGECNDIDSSGTTVCEKTIRNRQRRIDRKERKVRRQRQQELLRASSWRKKEEHVEAKEKNKEVKGTICSFDKSVSKDDGDAKKQSGRFTDVVNEVIPESMSRELRMTWAERKIAENKIAIIDSREKAKTVLATAEQKALRMQLQTLQLQEQIEVVRNRDLAAVRKRDEVRIMRDTEVSKVAVEKAYGYLASTGNVPGVVETVVSGSSGSISPNSSVSLQELNNVKEENSRLQERLDEYIAKHGEIFKECVEKAPTTCFTEDSKGCFPKRALALGYQRKHFARPNGSYRFRKIAPSRYYPPAQA